MIYQCRICGSEGEWTAFTMREMMLGTRDPFLYFQCGRCQCLQISAIPASIGSYYPPDYYSFSSSSRETTDNRAAKWFRKVRTRASAGEAGPVSSIIRGLFPNRKLISLAEVGISRDSRILDVGCGSGWRLYALREAGFVNTLGIDPFIKSDITYENGLKVLKRVVQDIDGAWDIIMFHHSFEHIPDQIGTLQAAAHRLNPAGTCLIRIPTVSSYAWEYYRENWYQIDAPRHYYLHSVLSMEMLAQKAGLSVRKIIYDSTVDQFRGSEICRSGVPLVQGGKFPREQVQAWKARARVLNRERRGDQAAFYLRKQERGDSSRGWTSA
jgi:SAM-dependent methyltransferase